MKQSKKNNMIVLVLAVILVVSIIISFWIGRYPIYTKELLGIVFSKIIPIDPFWTDKMETVLFNIRLPRIALACMVGCCLAAAGAAYQGVFQNPMAAPDILGASAGAAFGAALAIFNYGSGFIITVSAFCFSLITVALVFLLSKRVKGSGVLGLILSGIMIHSLFQAGTSFIKLVADPSDQLPAITYWLMGSLSGAKNSDIAFVIIPMAIGLIPLFFLRWRMNVLTMGDAEARTMGVNSNQVRIIAIVCATLLTAASVSVSGVIGWVGLVIPHLARKLVGNNYNHLMPTSMLLGAVFLLMVDNVSKNLFSTEIPLGILTAFVGAPFFIYLITRKGDIY